MFVTGAARTQPRAEPAADEVAIARAGNEFALSLYQRLAAEREGNLFFSPFSASTVLSMTWEGARGETAQEMRQVLRFPAPDGEPWPAPRVREATGSLLRRTNQRNPNYELVAANAMWGEQTVPFRPEFVRVNRPFLFLIRDRATGAVLFMGRVMDPR